MRFVLLPVTVLCLGFSADAGANQRKKASMSIESAKKQVAERLDLYRKTSAVEELRGAGNAIEQIEVHTVPDFTGRQAARQEKLALWLTLLDTIDSAKDPKFNPEDVPAARVTVPDTPMKPGVPVRTPEGIADPEVRRKYDQAVAANAEKTNRYRIQKELRQIDKELTSRAERYIASAYLRSQRSVKEMDEAIAQSVHHPDRASSLRALVKPAE